VKYKFSGLVNWTQIQLRRLGFCDQPLVPEFAEHTGKADLGLRSYFLEGPLGTQAKFAHLYGPRAEILNAMFYPTNAREVPVFAVELILFGKQPRVGVIDLQPALGVHMAGPLSQQVDRILEPIAARYRHLLTSGGDLPDWAEEHFTKHCIYSRPESLEELPRLLQAFRAYFRCWSQHFLPRETGLPDCAEGLADYQAHHVANTPGRRYLQTSFGPDWTERYLREFMYCSRGQADLTDSCGGGKILC
jgi:hypothetical protein